MWRNGFPSSSRSRKSTVGILVVGSKKYFILGEVNKPGSFPLVVTIIAYVQGYPASSTGLVPVPYGRRHLRFADDGGVFEWPKGGCKSLKVEGLKSIKSRKDRQCDII